MTNAETIRLTATEAPDPADAIACEIAKEQAEALGRAERKLLAAREDLRALDAGRASERTARTGRASAMWRLVEAVTAFIVQREACGFHDAAFVYDFYDVPAEVVARIGARSPCSEGTEESP